MHSFEGVRTHTGRYAFAVGTVLFLLQLLFWAVRIRQNYFPTGDEFSLLVHSTHTFHAHPAEWLQRGFGDYFRPYPDLANSYSNFLRPLDNVTFYLGSLVYGRAWASYLITNYLLVASVVSVTFALAYGVLKLPGWVVALVTVGAITSPAYDYQILYRPSFAFDYLAALCALLCALALIRQRWALAWVLVLLAVFSKETGFYTALSACAVVLLYGPVSRRSLRAAFGGIYLAPLLIMFGLRWLAFHRAAGVYVLNGTTPLKGLRNAVLGFTSWPVRLPGEQHIFELSVHNLGSLLLSAAVWVLLAFAAVALLQRRSEEQTPHSATAAKAVVLLFLAGSLLLPLSLNLAPRFAASVFPLLLLCLGALVAAGPGTWQAALALACVLVMVGANTVALPRTFSESVLASQRRSWNLSRSLVEQLHARPDAAAFLIGDVTLGFAAPESFATFAGVHASVVPVLNVTMNSPNQTLAVDATTLASGYKVHAPAMGGTYDLLAASKKVSNPGQTLRRDLPSAVLLYVGDGPSLIPDGYEWHAVDVLIQPKSVDYTIWVPDLVAEKYRLIGSGGVVRP